ncbi:unnamed protein product, partial [Rotaria sp. Silwood1]
MNSPSTSTAN